MAAKQYARFGGRSPLNQLNRDLIARIEQDLAANGLDLPVYFGNRHWHPFLGQTLDQMVADGVRHAAVFVTSAFGSYAGCRQYVDALDAEANRLGPAAPRLDKLRLYYDHPGFLQPTIDALQDVLAEDPKANVVFTAHSIPRAMAATSPYEQQLRSAAATILAKAAPAGQAPGRSMAVDLAFQSRSGSPSAPWLEPDINERIAELATSGSSHVIVVPLGFVSDHMEVRFDLDTQAAESAAQAGLRFTRLATPGTSATFAQIPRKLLLERYGNEPTAGLAVDPGGLLATACDASRCWAPGP